MAQQGEVGASVHLSFDHLKSFGVDFSARPLWCGIERGRGARVPCVIRDVGLLSCWPAASAWRSDGEVAPGSLAVRPGREASCADGLQKCLAAGPRARAGAAESKRRPGGPVLLPGAGGACPGRAGADADRPWPGPAGRRAGREPAMAAACAVQRHRRPPRTAAAIRRRGHPRREVVRFDMPGIGGSAEPVLPYHLWTLAPLLSGLLASSATSRPTSWASPGEAGCAAIRRPGPGPGGRLVLWPPPPGRRWCPVTPGSCGTC